MDNCLVVSYCGEELLRNEIGKYFELKEKSIGTPDQYLGVKMHQVVLDNGTTDWASRSIQYVQETVLNFELYLNNDDKYSMPRKSSAPIKNDYIPEIDSTK